jgi:hypothetical protein
VTVPGGSAAGGASGTSDEVCKGCGRTIPGTDWTCPHCGTTRWGMVIGTTVVGLLGILAAVAPGSPIWLRVVGGLVGLAFFVGAVEIRTGLRRKPDDGEPSPAAPVNPNVLQPASAPTTASSERRGPGRLAIGLAVVSAALGVLGVVWNSQIGEAEEETRSLQADVRGAGLRLEEARTDLAGLETEIATLQAQTAAAQDVVAALLDEAAEIDDGTVARRADFEAETADETTLAATLLEYEALLLGLADVDRDVARALAVVDATYALGVDAGNRRDVGDLEAAVSLEALETLLADLEAALAELEAVAAALEELPASLSADGEDGDG